MGCLVAFCGKRASEFLHEEKLARKGGHEGGGDPNAGAIPQSHPETHGLPAHATGQSTVTAADDDICLHKQAGANSVGATGHQRSAGFEAGNGILLDGQRM